MNTFRSETKDLLGSSFSDESGSANFFSTSLSCSSSYSSSLTPSRQLLLESTSENMDVIKEFRNLFLEKYLEKNKIGRRSKLVSKHRNQKSAKSCVDKNMEGENKVEYQSSCGKEEFDKFQIEFFNNDLLDVKAQSYSLNMNSYDEDSYENMNKISNSYTGNYESSYVSYYNPYYECPEKASEFFSNSLPMTNFSYDPTVRYCPKNSLENEPHLRSPKEAEGLRRISIMENENYRLTEDDNKIFNLEIENPQNNGLFLNNDNYTEFSSIF